MPCKIFSRYISVSCRDMHQVVQLKMFYIDICFMYMLRLKCFLLHEAFCREQHSRYRMEELIFNFDSSNVFFFSKHVLSGFKHLKLPITISALSKTFNIPPPRNLYFIPTNLSV